MPYVTTEMMSPAAFLEICRRLDRGERVTHQDVLAIVGRWEKQLDRNNVTIRNATDGYAN